MLSPVCVVQEQIRKVPRLPSSMLASLKISHCLSLRWHGRERQDCPQLPSPLRMHLEAQSHAEAKKELADGAGALFICSPLDNRREEGGVSAPVAISIPYLPTRSWLYQ